MSYRYNHPVTRLPSQHKDTGTVVATATVKETDGTTAVSGGGEVAGYAGVFGPGGQVVIRDGADSSGRPICTVVGEPGKAFDVRLPPEHWAEYADGLYATVSGQVAAFFIHTVRARAV